MNKLSRTPVVESKYLVFNTVKTKPSLSDTGFDRAHWALYKYKLLKYHRQLLACIYGSVGRRIIHWSVSQGIAVVERIAKWLQALEAFMYLYLPLVNYMSEMSPYKLGTLYMRYLSLAALAM
jgi:hypothetical protein